MTGPAELLRDFVNTYDVESDVDDLASPAELAVWLREHGLTQEGDRAVDGDLALAVRLREGLRDALRHNHDATLSEIGEGLDAALAALPLRVTLSGGVPALEPAASTASVSEPSGGSDISGASGMSGALARIAASIPAAHADGMWPRLKVCAESTCQWAFIDSSKNRSRSWCSMRVCGNRTKTRAYRARRQTDGSSRVS
ncbi:CGNR zinc finger domain-containing protein [Microtetraspora sp. AC03309]|uniref:CGNR zinc finger domain-containing protein n=1 Tax=Microtetraspora sp. AC03309 TaxID=2779376 RepID=UPI001E283F71|nr:CGNR zinc finger domain-containing protein [Microtetraspora sp. AC03309]MCC5575117.1 CGNR zinc finger domain-containing protein [Microtetraspora sp. AC03309]